MALGHRRNDGEPRTRAFDLASNRALKEPEYPFRVLRRNPDEVFLIEGHTDAVGSDVDNLSLSDRRASSVAQILSETFGVPPENHGS